jgi:hypothetical protein
MQIRAERANEIATPDPGIEIGSQVWVFLDRVRQGCAEKLAHQWHGPFRVQEMVEQHACKLEIPGSDYRIFPVVHVSRLKLCREHPVRPQVDLRVTSDGDRFDFDEALLPSDSWEPDEDAGRFEITEILDMEIHRPTRSARHKRRYLVRWRQAGSDPSWVDEEDIQYGGLLFDFHRSNRARHRLEMMELEQSE